MSIKVIYKEYVAQLKRNEATKPPQKRRVIPVTKDILGATGLCAASFSKYITNKNGSTNHRTLAAIIRLFRECGFDTDISDIITYNNTNVTSEN